MILCIETAAEYCSVAIAHEGKTVAFAEEMRENSHATTLTLLIQQALAQAKITARDLVAVAVSAGPGSYTGLRIGAATAKGIAYANDIPLIAVPTLQAVAVGAIAVSSEQSAVGSEQLPTANGKLYLPMLDARRMEVYMAAYNENGTELAAAEPFIITNENFSAYLERYDLAKYTQIVVCGNGATKAKTVLENFNINYLFNNCTSIYMSQIATDLYDDKKTENIAYFEPNYVKAVNITVAKPKNI